MKVVNNNQELFVSWKYDDPKNPSVTECIITDGEKNVVAKSSVKRYYSDVCSKEKARRFSLTKVLRSSYPSKDIRKIFWDAYLTRNTKS